MKAVLYFSLAYLANVHGFILLAPYLVLFLTIARTVQVTRSARAAPMPARVPAPVRY